MGTIVDTSKMMEVFRYDDDDYLDLNDTHDRISSENVDANLAQNNAIEKSPTLRLNAFRDDQKEMKIEVVGEDEDYSYLNYSYWNSWDCTGDLISTGNQESDRTQNQVNKSSTTLKDFDLYEQNRTRIEISSKNEDSYYPNNVLGGCIEDPSATENIEVHYSQNHDDKQDQTVGLIELNGIKREVFRDEGDYLDVNDQYNSGISVEKDEAHLTQSHANKPNPASVPNDHNDKLTGIKRQLVWNHCVQTYQLDSSYNKQRDDLSLQDSRAVVKEHKHSCLICGKTFKLEHSLLQHVFNKHSDDDKFEADDHLCLRRVCYNDAANRKVKHRRFTRKHYVKKSERDVQVDEDSGHLKIIIKQTQGINNHSYSHII